MNTNTLTVKFKGPNGAYSTVTVYFQTVILTSVTDNAVAILNWLSLLSSWQIVAASVSRSVEIVYSPFTKNATDAGANVYRQALATVAFGVERATYRIAGLKSALVDSQGGLTAPAMTQLNALFDGTASRHGTAQTAVVNAYRKWNPRRRRR